ncbi:MAG: nucleotide exchange factor GrpE [Muribaculaceae bacterium]|nr:nucleotide exchange factor GrpE [Muribaculaceae bacterium]
MGHNKNNRFNGNENNREDYINEVVPDDVAIGDVAEQPEQAEEIEVPVDDENGDEIEALKNLLQQKDEQIEKEKKEYLFLMADFDNFRKRTLKEKSEILKNGAESAMKGLLPIVDDFERGLDAIKDSTDAESVKEGMMLIYNKFVKYLEQNGVKVMETSGADFDPDNHEAVAMIPADSDEKRNKVVDTVTKGYTMNGKVIRHAKVVVAQ